MARNLVVAATVSVIMGLFSVAYRTLPPTSGGPTMSTAPDAQALMLFRGHVRPILETVCLRCHDSRTRSGGLDLSRREGALAGGDSGEAIVPGRPEESLMVQLVQAGEMPKEGAPLSREQVRALSEWVRLGASYETEPLVYRPPASSSGAFGGAMNAVSGPAMRGSVFSSQGMGGMMMCPCMQMMQQMMGAATTGPGAPAGPAGGATRLSVNPRTEEQARRQAEEYLKKLGNPYLQVGKVIETVGSWEIQVVTKDGSLVNWLIIDKQRGELRMMY